MDGTQRVRSKLKSIEKKENVKVLHSVLTGSRSYGLNSIDSDFDVKFIYTREPIDYIRFAPKSPVIEDSSLKNEGLEFTGFDITKALRLLLKPNIHVMEWFYSPVFQGEAAFFTLCKQLISESYNKHKAFNHYSLYKDSKTDLHKLRHVLCARWAEQFDGLPPIDLTSLLNVSTLFSEGEMKAKQEALTYVYSRRYKSRQKNFEQETPQAVLDLIVTNVDLGERSLRLLLELNRKQSPVKREEKRLQLVAKTEDYFFKKYIQQQSTADGISN